MTKAQTIKEKLQALSDDFAASLPAKLTKIDTIWQQVRSTNQAEDINDLIFFCHRLAGSGTSFGFKDVSEYARCIEVALVNLHNANDVSSPAVWNDASRIEIAGLVEQLLAANNAQKEDISNTDTFKEKLKPAADDGKPLIYLQEKNNLVLAELTSKLETYNYDTQNFSQLKDLKAAFKNNPPNSLLIDSTLFKADTRQLLMNLKQDYQFTLIHLADSNSFKDRLEAVRIGVDFYFTKPIDASNIIDTLDNINESELAAPARVLIVDDSISTSRFYALSLQSKGIQTKVVTDPFEVMDAVIEFKPELILLDLYMPKCSGLELAAVIRQQESYISTPIIFLSGETNAQKQLETLEMGADEFLTKPINVEQLIAVVKNKVIRYRQLSAYMHNDSLTGLLNHTSILSVLDTEIARAKRESSNISYAMIDIDFFKKVNDSYGHHMGDMVIKGIARFLKQRLRITDYVGRYGGEEFVAILPGVDATQTATIIQKILDAFFKIDFVHFNHKFNVSFSCGIADYASCPSASEIIDAADKALYVAKQDGRHCIRVTS